MKKVCVFCGSVEGKNPQYVKAARSLGACLASQGISVVYGAREKGLMGALADEALKQGGEVIGVIPDFLQKRTSTHPRLTKLHVVSSLPERKNQMFSLADAFIALPGGMGTLDELFEVIVGRQLQLHQKPIGLLNTNGFFNPLISFFDHLVKEEFVPFSFSSLLVVEENPQLLVQAIQQRKKMA